MTQLKWLQILQIWILNWKKTVDIKVLEETQIYDIPKGNFMKIIIVGTTSIPVLTRSKSAGNSFNFSCVGWSLVSFYRKCKRKKYFCSIQCFRGRYLEHYHAYKAVVVYDLIAVLVHEKNVPFLSCHPVYQCTHSYDHPDIVYSNRYAPRTNLF